MSAYHHRGEHNNNTIYMGKSRDRLNRRGAINWHVVLTAAAVALFWLLVSIMFLGLADAAATTLTHLKF